MKLAAALLFLSLGATSCASRVSVSLHRQLQDDAVAMPDGDLVADSAGNGGGRSNIGGKPGDFAGYVINKNDPRQPDTKCSYQFAPFDVFDPEISGTATMECSIPDICNFPGIVGDKTTIIGVNMVEMPNKNLKMTVHIDCYFGTAKALPIFICPSGYKAISLTQITGCRARRLGEEAPLADEVDSDMACTNLCDADINKSIDQTCSPKTGVIPGQKYEFKCKPQNLDDL